MPAPVSIRYVTTAGLLACTLLAGNLTERRIPERLAFPLQQISANIAGWKATSDNTISDATLRALNATSYLSRVYQKGPQNLDLFIAYYEEQRAGESMHSPKHCLPGAGWEIWQLGSAKINVAGRNVEINKYSIENGGVRMLMFYWYQSKQRIVASEYLGKIMLARDTLLTGRTAGSIVRVMLPDTPAATAEGAAFSAIAAAEVWRCLGGSNAAAAGVSD